MRRDVTEPVQYDGVLEMASRTTVPVRLLRVKLDRVPSRPQRDDPSRGCETRIGSRRTRIGDRLPISFVWGRGQPFRFAPSIGYASAAFRVAGLGVSDGEPAGPLVRGDVPAAAASRRPTGTRGRRVAGSEDWYPPVQLGAPLGRARPRRDRQLLGRRCASCEARFKDGTKLSIPADGTVDPVELKDALAGSGAVTVYLAVPALQAGPGQRRGDARRPTARATGSRRSRSSDENTGGDEQPIQVRRIRCRLLLSNQDHTGYEVLPLARVERSAQLEAPPQLDVDYVPPLLVARRLAAALAGRPVALPPDRRQGRAAGRAGHRPRHLVRQPGPRRRRAAAQAGRPQRRLLVLRGDRVRPRADPAVGLPRALPAGRPARDLHRGPPAPDPAAVRPRGHRRLLLHGHQVHPARARHDRPVGVREALLRAERRAAPGQPGAGLAEQHADAVPRASRPSWATRSASSSCARWT